MSFMIRRLLSTSSQRFSIQGTKKFILAIPAPLRNEAVLDTPELQQLARKAQETWTQLSNEEVVQLYRTQFQLSMREIELDNKSDRKVVIPGVILLISFFVTVAFILKEKLGPTKPHTYKNPQWEEATRKKLISVRANPISGISSKVKYDD